MDVWVPKHVVRAALMLTEEKTLTAAILHLIGAEEKTCQNERCGAMFVLQEGRSKHKQFRADAIYCSAKCARAQAQREYRRRQARS